MAVGHLDNRAEIRSHSDLQGTSILNTAAEKEDRSILVEGERRRTRSSRSLPVPRVTISRYSSLQNHPPTYWRRSNPTPPAVLLHD